MTPVPCVMKWSFALDGYVPVTNAVEASDIAKRCFFRSADHPSSTIEGRATALIAELETCETTEEKREAIVRALHAESATPVHPHVEANFAETVVGREWLEDWAKKNGQR